MTIDEAIKTLTFYHKNHEPYSDPLLLNALRLGIEALKRIKSIREGISLSAYVDLPGETKEADNG